MEENKKENHPSDEQKKENFFSKFIKKHILVLILILIIIGVFLYSMIRVSTLESRHEKQTSELITEYNAKIDSVTFSNMKLTVRVFTWAVRSEMIRENTEQVNHFFSEFIKEPKVIKIQLISHDVSEVLISTDIKDEGKLVDDKDYLVNTLHTKVEPEGIKFINPVMGMDKKLGVLVVVMEPINGD